MRIFLVSNMYPSRKHPNYGVFVKNFERNFEHDSDIKIVGKAVIKGRGKGVLSKALKYFVFFFETIYKCISLKYDFIYVHYINHSLIPIFVLNWFIDSPLILNFHGGDVFPEKSFDRILSKLSARIISESKLIVAPSDYLATEIRLKFNQNKEKIFISPSGGINLELFKPKIKSENDVLLLGFVGRIDRGKGWDIYLELLSELKKAGIKIKGIVVGKGENEKSLRERINKLHLNSIVRLVGFVSQKELVEIYQNIDVLIFPSHRKGESLGLVGLESMACGTPVIGSNFGGIASYVNSQLNGYLFNKDSVEDLLEKTIKFINLSYEEKLKMSENAVNTANQYDEVKVKQSLKARILELKNA